MRILAITPYFYPHPGGSQKYIEELYVAMMKLQPDLKVDILCYNTNNSPSEELYRGFHIYRVQCTEFLPGQFALPNPLQLIKVLAKLKKLHTYEVVNSHTRFFDTSWWTPMLAKYLHAQSILTDHCAEKPIHNFFIVNWVTWCIDHFWAPIIAQKYNHITVVSKATQHYLQTLGIPAETVVYPGVDTQFFAQHKNVTRQVPHTSKVLAKNEVVVSFMGRMIQSKGPQIFLESMSALLSNNSQLQIIVAGSGPLLNTLKDRYQHERITFTGQLNREEVAEVLNLTDVIVMPSTHHEGFPITILEAGAAGCAVITTAQGGTSEVITDEKTGLVIEPNVTSTKAAVQKLLDDSFLRRQLTSTLHETVKAQFTWEKSAQKFLNVTHKV
ncbi:glycosyltransferase family 4 protein [soil metagenome]